VCNGPFPLWRTLARSSNPENDIIYLVDQGKIALADSGYSDGDGFFETPTSQNSGTSA
jgi:hypothetical protein